MTTTNALLHRECGKAFLPAEEYLMLELTRSSGRPVAINPDAIATVADSSPSCKWRDIHCYIKTFDGLTYEVRESYRDVLALIDKYTSS